MLRDRLFLPSYPLRNAYVSSLPRRWEETGAVKPRETHYRDTKALQTCLKHVTLHHQRHQQVCICPRSHDNLHLQISQTIIGRILPQILIWVGPCVLWAFPVSMLILPKTKTTHYSAKFDRIAAL